METKLLVLILLKSLHLEVLDEVIVKGGIVQTAQELNGLSLLLGTGEE